MFHSLYHTHGAFGRVLFYIWVLPGLKIKSWSAGGLLHLFGNTCCVLGMVLLLISIFFPSI